MPRARLTNSNGAPNALQSRISNQAMANAVVEEASNMATTNKVIEDIASNIPEDQAEAIALLTERVVALE